MAATERQKNRQRLLKAGVAFWGLCWLCINAILGWATPAAASLTPEPLTVEALSARLEHPIQQDGRATIDLHQVTLDLRPENGEFQASFYRLLRRTLQGSEPLSLDLSQSTIRGALDLQRLSQQEPLYGEAFLALLPGPAQAQLKRDRQRLSQLNQLSRSLLIQPQSAVLGVFLFRGDLNISQSRFEGPVTGSNTFFLGTVRGRGARFVGGVSFNEARFTQKLLLGASRFQQAVQFRSCLFFQPLQLEQAIFQETVTFQGSEFYETPRFRQVTLGQAASFERTTFQKNADFSQTQWREPGSFVKSTLTGSLFLNEAVFEKAMDFRQIRLNQSANLRGATVQEQLDFGDAVFAAGAYINVSGLDFNASRAEFLGNPGQIGQALSVPTLEGNQTLLRNLVRNFRQLEQIADANQVEYLLERLRLRSFRQRLTAVNLNTASPQRLQAIGFSLSQAETIVEYRQQVPFVTATDSLDIDGIDLATYVRVRDRIVAQPALSWLGRCQLLLRTTLSSLLLLTSNYGTSVGLVLGVGTVAIALSSLLFWGVDRYRRRLPTPILPPRGEVLWMGGSAALLLLVGGTTILRLGHSPVWTTGAIAAVVLPVPLVLMALLHRQGRFHDRLESSYLVEDGSIRQLRLLIARLPIIPQFPFFRDRYSAIDWERRRNWLNYYDFELNNWLKFGFNDIRLRDEAVPGLVTALVWYQWAAGIAYVALLLWTLSRTIPGLNLLIYF